MQQNKETLELIYKRLLDSRERALMIERGYRNAYQKVAHLPRDNTKRLEAEKLYREAYRLVIVAKGKVDEFVNVHPSFSAARP